MDRALYVAMSGALQTMRAQTANNQNIANASTNGFKAELAASSIAPVAGAGLPTRVNATAAEPLWDSSMGGLQQTGRDLDVALAEGRWLAVQSRDGSEAYTRAGDLQLDANGQLRTAAGDPVLGDGGPLSVPPSTGLTIAGDGTITVVPLGQAATTVAVIGRLKVVDAQPAQLDRGADGLFRPRPTEALDPAAGNVVMSGALEASNVSLPECMATMIQLARAFEMQMKVMHSVEENAQASATLVRMG